MITGFQPIVGADARVLILGSMPGQASLDISQYYAHPRNAFWPIIGRLLNAESAITYAQRLTLLKANRIALWDVMRHCEREGSLDSAIEQSTVIANDFVAFLADNPSIRSLFFNGAQAEASFKRHVSPLLSAHGIDLEMTRLPSTSPAHAAMSFAQKLTQWQRMRDVIAL